MPDESWPVPVVDHDAKRATRVDELDVALVRPRKLRRRRDDLLEQQVQVARLHEPGAEFLEPRRAREVGGQALFTGAQRLLDPLSLGDVQDDAEKPNRFA